MAGALGDARIKGLRELQRSLNKVNKEVAKTVRDELKTAGEPVRQTAERMAFGEIRNIGTEWGRMRLGTRPGSVYIAPRSRRAGGSPRPNLGGLLLNEAMWPALKQHENQIVQKVEQAFDRLTRSAGF